MPRQRLPRTPLVEPVRGRELLGEDAFAGTRIIPPTLLVEDRMTLDLGGLTSTTGGPVTIVQDGGNIGTFTSVNVINNPGSFQAALGWYAGYSDPAMLPLWFVPKAAGFTGGYQTEDAALIKSIEGLRAMPENDKSRAAAIQSVCDQIHTQANQIPLITRVETMAFRKDRIKADGIGHKDGYADNLHQVATYTKL